MSKQIDLFSGSDSSVPVHLRSAQGGLTDSIADTIGQPKGAKTGYDVVCWMEANDVWPRDGVKVHSLNPSGAARMRQVIERAYAARTPAPDTRGERT